MTDDFMEMVKTDLEVWKERKDREIEEYNNGVPKRRAELRKEIRINKRIHELLNEENVEEFSRLIGYKEDENKLKLLCEQLDRTKKKTPGAYFPSERDHLLEYLFFSYDQGPIWTEKQLKSDKYLIYCYISSIAHSRGLPEYTDRYCSLQYWNKHFYVNDYVEWGKRRERFKNKNEDSIIYDPYDNNWNRWTFSNIQTEFVEEALKTNQENAKKLILSKYGKK